MLEGRDGGGNSARLRRVISDYRAIDALAAPLATAGDASSAARPEQLTVYGAEWCRDCRRSKAVLDVRRVSYVYVDLAAHPTRADEAEALTGRKTIPVLVFPDGEQLVEPTNAELCAKLDRAGL
ncbi:Glutaredoxin [Promicromonospora umidemergens]|uniref:Glutaredoxin domain-containing protein n=1 Tax=Promicromonospora umidemergens TaxID=629679 RepID=A0ABP8X5Q4_9MICO|nr:Glutaredoxin [Promicromonospora umidemergens]